MWDIGYQNLQTSINNDRQCCMYVLTTTAVVAYFIRQPNQINSIHFVLRIGTLIEEEKNR
jgi:hypothetical protein